MSVLLTPEQQVALDREDRGDLRFIDPRTNATYRLVPESEAIALREIQGETTRRQVMARIGLRNAAARLAEQP